MNKGLAFSGYAEFPTTWTPGTFPTFTGGKMLDYDIQADVNYTARNGKFYASNRLRAQDNGLASLSADFEEGEINRVAAVDLLGEIKKAGTSGAPDHYHVTNRKGKNVTFMWAEWGEDDDGDYYETWQILKTSFGRTTHTAKTAKDSIDYGTEKIHCEAEGIIIDSDEVVCYVDIVRFRDKTVEGVLTTAEAQALAYIKTTLGITTPEPDDNEDGNGEQH